MKTNPRILFIAAALGIAFIASVNFVKAPSSDMPSFAAASMSGGSAGTTQSGGGGW
jgi:hypothetical protein